MTTRAEMLNSERAEKAKPFSDTFEASSKEDEKKTEDKHKESERLRNKYPNLYSLYSARGKATGKN